MVYDVPLFGKDNSHAMLKGGVLFSCWKGGEVLSISDEWTSLNGRTKAGRLILRLGLAPVEDVNNNGIQANTIATMAITAIRLRSTFIWHSRRLSSSIPFKSCELLEAIVPNFHRRSSTACVRSALDMWMQCKRSKSSPS